MCPNVGFTFGKILRIKVGIWFQIRVYRVIRKIKWLRKFCPIRCGIIIPFKIVHLLRWRRVKPKVKTPRVIICAISQESFRLIPNFSVNYPGKHGGNYVRSNLWKNYQLRFFSIGGVGWKYHRRLSHVERRLWYFIRPNELSSGFEFSYLGLTSRFPVRHRDISEWRG